MMKSMKTKKEILDKISKLLRLADDRGATEGEVANAMAAAKQLARRHDIDISSVSLDDPDAKKPGLEVTKDSSIRTKTVRRQPYHKWVYATIEEVFDITIIRSGYNDQYGDRIDTTLHFIGTPMDVEIAKVIFPFLEKLFPRIYNRKVKERMLSRFAADMNGFYLGFYRGIREANKRKKEELSNDDANRYAMVLVSKQDAIQLKVNAEFPNLKFARACHAAFSGRGVATGEEEGKKIKLNQLEK